MANKIKRILEWNTVNDVHMVTVIYENGEKVNMTYEDYIEMTTPEQLELPLDNPNSV